MDEETNRAQQDFLAMLGHELRNPLSPIVIALHLIRERNPRGIERELTVIDRQVAHLSRLVDDLLDVSRIAQGRIELKRESVDLREIVVRAIDTTTPLFERRRLHVRVKLADDPLCVMGDAVRLVQIVGNVLTNAAKYTPVEGHVDVRCVREGARALVSVADDGVGIRAEMMPRIFDLFTQERQEMDRAAGGLGLGLSIVRSLVELHGGRIEASSPGLGKGSTFALDFPLLEETQLSLGLREPSVRPTNAPRILIVDDNIDAADTLSDALTEAGFATMIAHDGPDALRIAEEFQPSLALLDIGLPVMDGYELAVCLRKLPSLRTVRLVALTGYGRPEDRDRARSAGFDEHLVKPISIERLQETVCRLLSA